MSRDDFISPVRPDDSPGNRATGRGLFLAEPGGAWRKSRRDAGGLIAVRIAAAAVLFLMALAVFGGVGYVVYRAF